MTFESISRWVLYIKFFFKNATKKDRFHIHLIDRTLILCFNGKYNSDGIHPCYKRKRFHHNLHHTFAHILWQPSLPCIFQVLLFQSKSYTLLKLHHILCRNSTKLYHSLSKLRHNPYRSCAIYFSKLCHIPCRNSVISFAETPLSSLLPC